MNAKEIERQRKQAFLRRFNISLENATTSSKQRTTTTIKSFSAIKDLENLTKVRDSKQAVLSKIYDYEAKKANWQPGSDTIVYCQYIGALPLFGTNWLLIEEVRYETEAELIQRAENTPYTDVQEGGGGAGAAVSVEPKRKLLISFIGLEDLYRYFGAKTDDEVVTNKLWFNAPPFWESSLAPYIGKKMTVYDKTCLGIYVYDILERTQQTESGEQARNKVFVMGKAVLFEDSLEKISKTVVREIFPTLKLKILSGNKQDDLSTTPSPVLSSKEVAPTAGGGGGLKRKSRTTTTTAGINTIRRTLVFHPPQKKPKLFSDGEEFELEEVFPEAVTAAAAVQMDESIFENETPF